ncbi:hypothetical protein EVAR_27476_1 [Eumeta japonica]|uniref:Uncharacterized protein n=1 Tax=Eumeta variegata TaxID=151549 RepID=A0A4C1XH25_EUMVA|nr:hypothetical protein EVAR_27476_1 [Eumeta japonica]
MVLRLIERKNKRESVTEYTWSLVRNQESIEGPDKAASTRARTGPDVTGRRAASRWEVTCDSDGHVRTSRCSTGRQNWRVVFAYAGFNITSHVSKSLAHVEQ